MFQLRVDDDIVRMLAEERHALAMTDLIKRTQPGKQFSCRGTARGGAWLHVS